MKRLEAAGLVVRHDSTPATEPPLTTRGVALHLGTSDLELYLFPDSASRAREEARLDRAKYLDAAAPVGIQPLPTLIHSVNLLAILNSRNDHLRERVSDALTAGPPQPPRP